MKLSERHKKALQAKGYSKNDLARDIRNIRKNTDLL
jgi:hypothetical protein